MKRWLNKTHCGNCLEILAELPPESVDIALTSPPYNIKNSTGNGLKNGSGKWRHAGLIGGYDNYDDCMPRADYVSWQKECIAAILRTLKPTGALFYNHKPRVQGGLLEDPIDIVGGGDFPLRQIIIWRRKGGINFNPGYFLPTYELIYLIAKPKFKLAAGQNRLGDVWDISQNSDKNPHPAPFPLELALRCVRAGGGQVVLDPFIGSGTTALAAKALQRDYIGIDKSAQYCKMARRRIREYPMQEKIEYGSLHS